MRARLWTLVAITATVTLGLAEPASRTQRQWQQHLMAVNAAGQFTGQWLFDGVIVTTQDIDGHDIMYTRSPRCRPTVPGAA